MFEVQLKSQNTVLKDNIGRVLDTLLSVLFPPLCLHCKEEIEPKKGHLFCPSCIQHLELIDPLLRCKRCFREHDVCICRTEPNDFFLECGSAFDYQGPPKTLIKVFKYGYRPALAKEIAAFMVVQFFHLEWPIPDLIVPVPQSFSHFFLRKFHQTLFLATEVGTLLQRPVCNLLKRKSGDFSQASLNQKKRQELSSSSFFWNKKKEISDMHILLIDDVLTTGATMRACASKLKEGHPKSIYGLVFCCSPS